MSISRRSALGAAAALAVTSNNGVASALAGALSRRNGHSRGGSGGYQNFLELLIHHDEAGPEPYKAAVSVASPDTAWYAADTMDVTKYKMTNHSYKMRGYRLRRVNAFWTREGVRYAACWQLASGPEWHTRHGMSREQIDAAILDYQSRGFRMTYIDARQRYSAIWERGDASSQQIFSALSQSEFEQKLAELSGQGYKPLRISTVTFNKAPRFAAIFEKNAGGTVWQSRHLMRLYDFRKAEAQLGAQGYRLTDAAGQMLGNKPLFSGIWEQA